MANVFMKEFPVIVLKKRVIIVISLCVTMILLFLQPFSFGVYRHYAIFPALGYGGVTFISMHVFNSLYLQPIITQYFIDNKSEIWLLFLIAHSKR